MESRTLVILLWRGSTGYWHGLLEVAAKASRLRIFKHLILLRNRNDAPDLTHRVRECGAIGVILPDVPSS